MAGAKGRRGGARTPSPAPRATPAPTRSRPAPRPAAQPDPLPAGPFRLGIVPGATPGKWIDRWNARMPANPIALEEVAVATQREALAGLDAAFVRLPIDRDGIHVIALYDEVSVVVASAGSHLAAADGLTAEDLAGEVLIRPADDVLGVEVAGTTAPRFEPPATTADAVATIAAGVGITILPMSLARLHARRDVAVRPLVDGPVSSVALAWEAARTTPLVDAFVGVVRGRTERSSRG